MGNARKNMFGMIGAEIGMDDKMTPVITNSLSEGYPKDKEALASLFNSSRKGSIMRGHMTQESGADANITMRVINSIVVKEPDCKTSDTMQVLITDDTKEEYVDYYTMKAGKPLLLTKENIESYVGKTIPLRSYMYCKTNDGYCGVCAGRQGEDNKNIAIILSTEISSIFTNNTMKSMHDKTVKVVDYDLNTALGL